MSYDAPVTRQYSLGQQNLASGNIVATIPCERIPLGGAVATAKQGRVRAVLVHGTTVAFTQTTTAGAVQIGDGTTANKYYDTGLVLGSGVGISANVLELKDGGAAVDIESGRSTITVTLVAPTGGTPAGTASFTVVIDWF